MVWEISKEDLVKVLEIRSQFGSEFEANRQLYEEEDWLRIKSNDFYVWRFLREKEGDVGEALHMLVNSMRWRKEYGIKDIKETEFPREMFRIAGSHFYVPDKKGIITYYNRLCVPPAPREFMPLITRMVAYTAELMDRIVVRNRSKLGLVVDCRNSAVNNANAPNLREMTISIQGHYPGNFTYIAYYEMPKVMKVKVFAPKTGEDQVIYLDKDNIDEVIGLENVPDYMGGTCKTLHYGDMDHCPSVEEVCKGLGIPQEAVDEFHKLYDPFLNEYQLKREEREKADKESRSTLL